MVEHPSKVSESFEKGKEMTSQYTKNHNAMYEAGLILEEAHADMKDTSPQAAAILRSAIDTIAAALNDYQERERAKTSLEGAQLFASLFPGTAHVLNSLNCNISRWLSDAGVPSALEARLSSVCHDLLELQRDIAQEGMDEELLDRLKVAKTKMGI